MISDLPIHIGYDKQKLTPSFLVAFSIPYLLYEPYAALSSKVGFIFAPICVLAGLWVFCKPIYPVLTQSNWRSKQFRPVMTKLQHDQLTRSLPARDQRSLARKHRQAVP